MKTETNEGNIKFVKMITHWLKMMHVKDKYSCVRIRDEFHSPWIMRCDSFKRLNEICGFISTRGWKGWRDRAMKLIKMAAYAFIITNTDIDAAYYLQI